MLTWPEGILCFADRRLVFFFSWESVELMWYVYRVYIFSIRAIVIAHAVPWRRTCSVSIETTQVQKSVSLQPGWGKLDLFFFCGAKSQVVFCFLFFVFVLVTDGCLEWILTNYHYGVSIGLWPQNCNCYPKSFVLHCPCCVINVGDVIMSVCRHRYERVLSD